MHYNALVAIKPLQVFVISSLLCLIVAVFHPAPGHRKYEQINICIVTVMYPSKGFIMHRVLLTTVLLFTYNDL